MAASLDTSAAAPTPPPLVLAAEEALGAEGDAEQARTLVGALNLLSRNLPLPSAVLRAVSSIYHEGDDEDEEEEPDAVGNDGEPADAGGDTEVWPLDIEMKFVEPFGRELHSMKKFMDKSCSVMDSSLAHK